MKPFMDQDFLLGTDTARYLYHSHAATLPIIDYHCHLDPRMVAEDHRFRSITELWLGGDHYKWRAMRTDGIEERFITGTDTTDWEKFEQWAATVPHTFRNPLYHWTHMELRTAFGIDTLLNPDNAREIYDACNALLQEPGFTARGLMRRYHVEVVCTTDDPVDSLEWHRLTHNDGFEVRMLPTWRPDKVLAIDDPSAYMAYVQRLSEASGVQVRTYTDLLDALRVRHAWFEAHGCRLSDHGLNTFPADDYTDAAASALFCKLVSGHTLTPAEAAVYKSALLTELAAMDAEAGWTQQFHYGVLRNNNTRMYRQAGPDTGFDSIGTSGDAQSMNRFFDRLDQRGQLAKTIIYPLNPSDYDMVATLIGNFQDSSVPGKMQLGSAWWFNDQKEGMQRQIDTLSALGLLSRFVGMLTDSRSFLSYPRHDYFRRILCNLIGRDVENGELPVSELPQIARMVEDICYYNAKSFFKLD